MLDYKESWAPKNWWFWTVVLEKPLDSPLECKEIQLVHPKGDQSWVFIGRTDAEAETPKLWTPDPKSRLFGKDPDAGSDWGQEEKGTTEDEMVGWHHQLNGHEFEQAPGVGDGQEGLAYCSPWFTKSWMWLSDWTDWLIYMCVRVCVCVRACVCIDRFIFQIPFPYRLLHNIEYSPIQYLFMHINGKNLKRKIIKPTSGDKLGEWNLKGARQRLWVQKGVISQANKFLPCLQWIMWWFFFSLWVNTTMLYTHYL